MVRAEVARRAGGVEPDRVNLISAGRVLRDDPPASLQQAGLKSNAKIMKHTSCWIRLLPMEAESLQKLDAAKALSQRHTDGSFPEEDFNVDLEDQSGHKVMFGSVDDIKALKMALMLHQNAKNFIKRDMHKDALDVLMMAEEAFSLCDPKLIERVDNVPMLQLDIVWCYLCFVMLLQAGRHADLAIYVRLELLEGVVAYHNGRTEKARESLNSAQAKYMQLQVPDEAISILMGMGYGARAAKRALKMTGYDIQSSVDLLCEEREKKFRRIQEDREMQEEILEQRKYGKTPMKKAVDIKKLKFLVTIGKILSRAMRSSRGSGAGSSSSSAATATAASDVNNSQAPGNTSTTVPDGSATEGSNVLSVMNEDAVNNNGEAANNDEEDEDAMDDGASEGDEDANPPPAIARDVVMENELANELTGDVLDDYDIDVSNEGQAIAEYLSLLESAVKS
ncbi:hypothetical protein GUJ93_ZPchr0458g22754 [Zizania palustris]|uniref:NEDD8 ultimate buster 1 n=1 Tax=Zizania palustris TaxID=103762 RepID=A0A8J5R798_ZIZPA|nr:hypothetical protein GUJ93_ZPchr0458g22754 [Zizania palustris]